MMPELFRRGFTRICMYCTLIFISAAACGQDTNSATGPQYLITTGAPMLARAISTPSLSFPSPPLEVGADIATARLTAGAESQPVLLPPADALSQVDFFDFFCGTPPLSVIEISFAEPSVRPIAPIPALFGQGWLWEENAGSILASGAGEVDETMLDVGANQLDAQFISDVEALSALRQ
jgi:hypothetical protein